MPTRPPRHSAAIPRRVAPGPEPRPAPRVHSNRLKTAERGYDSKWQRSARAYLRKHPLCVHCLEKGIVEAAQVVDHIKPHGLTEALRSGDPEAIHAARLLFWDSDNWQALSKVCHDRKTATEDGGFGNQVKHNARP